MSATAYIALGSNLENPIQQIRNGISALADTDGITLQKRSSLYQTAPVGYTAEKQASIPDFINAVIAVETTRSPEDLLSCMLAVEDAAGRTRPYHYAPRVLDCDLLLYDAITMHTPSLTLPHPRMHTRGFVLLPLFEIAPHLALPKHGKIATLITPDIAEGVQQLSLK